MIHRMIPAIPEKSQFLKLFIEKKTLKSYFSPELN